MQIIDNFIQDKNIFDDIKNLLMSYTFPYYYYNQIAHEKDKSDYFFQHVLYDKDQPRSEYFYKITMPILGRLNFNHLVRAKVNCYTKKHTHIHTKMHTDLMMNKKPFEHRVALLSINNNNGYTRLKGKKIKSRENQIIMFKGNELHASSTCSDQSIRININFNYL